MANKYAGVIQSGVNNYLTSATTLNGLQTDLVAAGVVGAITSTAGVAPTTGSFAVNAQGSPNMTVAVSGGQAYVTATPTGGSSQRIRVTSDASENVTISANATGGTRYDWVYIKVDADKLNNPSVSGTDVVTFITQRSTTLATDSNGTPANSYAIATVTVINGASSIANSDITDRRSQTSAIVIPSQLSAGMIVQKVSTNFSSLVTGTTVLPFDDTIPQITEGIEVMTQAITPVSSTNTLLIEVSAMLSHSAIGHISMALFQDSTVGALSAGGMYLDAATGNIQVPMMYKMTAGTTSSTTFRVRAGSAATGTLSFNGQAGVRRFGGIAVSAITITEIKV